MSRNSTSDPENHIHQQNTLLKVANYLSQHYREQTNITQISEIIQVAEEEIDALFRRYKGKSAADALLQYKLNGLCDRLGENLSKPIEELMIECGLNPSNDSYAAFKKYFGISIHEYRQQYHSISGRDFA